MNKNTTQETNTLLVGAGPIGVEVAAALKATGDTYIHVEAGALGETISRWTPNTLFFSSPEWIAIAGIPVQTYDQRRITGEEYLSYLRQVVETLSLNINFYQKVTKIEKSTQKQYRYCVHTQAIAGGRCYFCNNIVLAIGDMHTHRMLGIDGETLPTVSHLLQDPHYYFQQRLLIVGGRNSACEAALRCWRAGAQVAISYRKDTLPSRGILARLKLEIELLIQKGQIVLYAPTIPTQFASGSTQLKFIHTGELQWMPTDFVFVATGFEPTTSLYHQIGVTLKGKAQQPYLNHATQETNCKGVYVAGTATAGNQDNYTVFITTCHDHATKIAYSITGNRYEAVGNLAPRNFSLQQYDLE